MCLRLSLSLSLSGTPHVTAPGNLFVLFERDVTEMLLRKGLLRYMGVKSFRTESRKTPSEDRSEEMCLRLSLSLSLSWTAHDTAPRNLIF